MAIESAPPPLPPTPTSIASLFSTDALFNNPLFAGGLGLAGLGAAAAVARQAAVRVAGQIRRRMLVHTEISKTDPSYEWVLKWMALPRDNSGLLASRLTRIHDISMRTTVDSLQPGGATSTFYFAEHGYGRHFIKVGGVYVHVQREKQSTANLTTGVPHETMTFTTLFSQRQVFHQIFKEANDLQELKNKGKIVTWAVNGFAWAQDGQPQRKRPLSSVILDEGLKERIVGDVKEFQARQKWYTDRGIPYYRGYLLYGPPGTGKSCFIQALAAELDFGIASINLGSRGMTDDKLKMLLRNLPRRTFLLLEDADATFSNRRQVDHDGYSGASVTFSGLLNALDGVNAGEERITFLTTNHIERLDPALIRPGRVDVMTEFGKTTRYQAGQMWERFYGDVDPDGVYQKRFLDRLQQSNLIGVDGSAMSGAKEGTTAAAIQGLFLLNKETMEGAISGVEYLVIHS